MVDQAPGPGAETVRHPAYPRASIEDFIQQAEAERTRLHVALQVAHDRRRAAELARFDAVGQILARAEAEAVRLVSAARAEADAIRAGQRSTPVRPSLDLVG